VWAHACKKPKKKKKEKPNDGRKNRKKKPKQRGTQRSVIQTGGTRKKGGTRGELRVQDSEKISPG